MSEYSLSLSLSAHKWQHRFDETDSSFAVGSFTGIDPASRPKTHQEMKIPCRGHPSSCEDLIHLDIVIP